MAGVPAAKIFLCALRAPSVLVFVVFLLMKQKATVMQGGNEEQIRKK